MQNQRDFCWNDKCRRKRRRPLPPPPPFRPPMPPPPPPRPLPPRPTPYWDDRDMWMQEDEPPYSFEYEYMVEYYPVEVRWLNAYIGEVIDQMDEPTSFIYDEYPDKNRIYKLVDEIYKILVEENENMLLKQMIQVLVIHEIFYRRAM